MLLKSKKKVKKKIIRHPPRTASVAGTAAASAAAAGRATRRRGTVARRRDAARACLAPTPAAVVGGDNGHLHTFGVRMKRVFARRANKKKNSMGHPLGCPILLFERLNPPPLLHIKKKKDPTSDMK